MKTIHAAARAAVLAAFFFGVLAGTALAIDNPIPGVDIIVKKHPGGSVVHATSDKDGRFVFENLTAGRYELSVTPPQTKAPIITSRSNIKRPSITAANGVQEAQVSVEIGTGPASAEIVITSAKGRITGTVTRAIVSGNSPSIGGKTK